MPSVPLPLSTVKVMGTRSTPTFSAITITIEESIFRGRAFEFGNALLSLTDRATCNFILTHFFTSIVDEKVIVCFHTLTAMGEKCRHYVRNASRMLRTTRRLTT